MKTRIAVIGLGKMGLMHSSIFSMLEGVELAALCEKSRMVRRYARKMIPGVDIVDSVDSLAGRGLDALCITTPPGSHYSIIRAIYEQQIARHIFTEKPLAVNHEQAARLCSLAGAAGGVNMVGYHRRFSVTFRRAQGLIVTGTIGRILSFKGHAYSADFLGARSTRPAIGRGGVIEDSGCHVIDIALWLLGDMEPVAASVKSLIGKGSEDEASITARTAGGIEGVIEMSWCREGYRLPDMCLTVTGDRGEVTVNEDSVRLTANGKKDTWYKHDLADDVPFFIGGAEYRRQDELFIKAIEMGTKAEPDFRTAARVHKLVDAAVAIARRKSVG